MKPILKSQPAPQALTLYANENPHATWEELRNENPSPYNALKIQIVQDQFRLCAYCECQIDAEQFMSTQIEHFHPKSDTSNPNKNWALLWENMIGVCNGGTSSTPEEKRMYPTPKNLSCDSHKNLAIQGARLDDICKGLKLHPGEKEKCEGYILNPLEMITFPILFQINRANGFLEPNRLSCQSITFPVNNLSSTYELVENTIKALNLNCDRLAQQRLRVIRDIDKNKRTWQKSNLNVNANLLSRYLDFQWRPFFTTIRLCLGQIAEQHLQNIQFRG